MSKWVARQSIPYEGVDERFFDSAADVIDYLNSVSADCRADIRIEPDPCESFEPYEFEAAYAIGEIQ